MNTNNPESGSTSRLNFGGSSPFTSGQTEPLMDVPATEDVPAALANDDGEGQVSAPHPIPEQAAQALENVTQGDVNTNEGSTNMNTVENPTEVPEVAEAPAEAIVEAPVVENNHAPEVLPPSPQEVLEANVAAAKGEVGIPEEAPVIGATADAAIEKAIAERDALNAKIEEGQKSQRVEVINQIKSVVNTYKIPLNELAEALGIKGTRKGSKAKPKYKDPASDKTWSGRGKEPLWIKGKDRNSFLITT